MALYIAITICSIGLAWLAERFANDDAGRNAGVYSHMDRTGSGWTGAPADAGHHPRGVTRARAGAMLCLVMLFLLLWIPESLREETGNDYMRYVEFFHLSYANAYVPTEEGFNDLVRAVYHLCGYENYLLVFALFAFGTIALFLAALWQQARYEGKRYFAFSFALFMLCGYYFQSYNTVRYYLALAAAMFSIRYLLERKYAAFLAIVLLASLFHRSVLIVLLLYPLALHVWKKWQLLLVGVFGVSFLALHSQWMQVIVRLYPSYEDSEILAAGGHFNPGNTLRCILVLVFALWVLTRRNGALDGGHTGKGLWREFSTWYANRQFRFYANATWLALAIYVFAFFVPELSRICYYLLITQVFFLPMLVTLLPVPARTPDGAAWNQRDQMAGAEADVCSAEKTERSRGMRGLTRLTENAGRMAQIGILCVALIIFASFLHSASADNIRILPYHCFLFHEMSRTPSGSIH